MLKHIRIDGFQRIAYADIDLTTAPIHVFVGANEAGKSSLKEAIAFCIRGLSPRVEYKKEFDQLIYRGKKNGNVSLNIDGFDLVRTIKDGKLKTVAPLDYPELLVDLQLGVQEFGRTDGAAIRKLLQLVFKMDATVDVIRSRLTKDGVRKDILERTLPLIKASGFESASDTAKSYQLEKTAAWTALTGEKYGSQKAVGWQPAQLASLKPINQAQIDAADAEVKESARLLSIAQKGLGALEHRAKLHEDAQAIGSVDIDALKASVGVLDKAYTDRVNELEKARGKRDQEMQIINDDILNIEHQIQETKMTIVTLECPCCAKPLKLNTDNGGTVSLVVAEEVKRREGPAMQTLAAQLKEANELKADLSSQRNEKIAKIERLIIDDQRAAASARDALNKALSTPVTEPIEAADVERQAARVTEEQANEQLKRSALDKLRIDAQSYSTAIKTKADAERIADEAGQWAIVAKSLSNDPDSIPSELIGKTIGPINAEMLACSLAWEQMPVALAANMTLARGDGEPYHMLSESAKWRADVTVQLALAKLSTLKLVCVDRLDVLELDARPAFFEMLKGYAAANPDISVLCFGTLRKKPANFDGVDFWWVQDGEISAVQPS